MKTLVVYDSVFGNTEQIARAVGRAVAAPENVEVLRVASAPREKLQGVELLIVGSPTRGFRPTEATTKFLDSLPAATLRGVKVAAFDTRISVKDVNNVVLTAMERVFGYAAEPIGKKLTQKGGTLAVPPEGFFVKGSEGPLKAGELERATTWAASIAKGLGQGLGGGVH